jgi:hypothetical protein
LGKEIKCATAKDIFVVVLSTPTTVKVAEIVLWIHHSRVAHCCHVGAPVCCRRSGPWSQETTRDHKWWDVSPAIATPEADLSKDGRTLRSCHFTFEDESLPCFLLVSSLPGDPQVLDYGSCTCSTQTRSVVTKNFFPYLLFLCRHSCWAIHPQPYHLLSVLSWQSVSVLTPREQCLEVQTTGELLSRHRFTTQKANNIYFYMCTVIAKNSIYQPQGLETPLEA